MEKKISVSYDDDVYDFGFSFFLKDFIYQVLNETKFDKNDVIIGLKNILNTLEGNLVFKNYDKDEDSAEFIDEASDCNPNYPGYFDTNDKEISTFYKSEIAVHFSLALKSIEKAQALDDYESDVIYRIGLLGMYKKHIEKWLEMFGNLDEYDFYFPYGVFESCFKAMVVYRNEKGIDRFSNLLIDIHNIFFNNNKELFDLDIFNHTVKKFKKGVKYSKIMINYISNNPGVLQKNIFKLLSLDGRDCSYILEYADKIGVIFRTRHKDTWTLKMNKNKKNMEFQEY